MKSKCVAFLVVALLFACAAGHLFAADSRLALSAKAGTLGGGLEGIVNITPHFNVRAGANTFQYDYDGKESDINYDFDLELLTFAGLVDWFPFDNGFRVTGGCMANENSLELKATTAGTYDIGGVTYTSAEVGTLKGELDFNSLAPYLGIGYGNPFGTESNWSFNFDIGVMFQGSPDLSVTTDGTLAANAAFQANLAREKADLEDELDEFEFYPVISFGVTYRF
ncbi:MAG TPA: hypothetical protein P5110_02400 [Candidatus Omnitrophota bacterium]|nr:hypothetical protein [Candidatus Omnitrophota bacterium]HRZ14338.1 hypothetical protein [Candidatus Omnitrophota bacterium]